MSQSVSRIGPLSAAKVAGVLYSGMGLLFAPFLLIPALMGGDSGMGTAFGVGMAIAMPVFYGVMGFVMTGIGCWMYNIIAGWVGGIEIELK